MLQAPLPTDPPCVKDPLPIPPAQTETPHSHKSTPTSSVPRKNPIKLNAEAHYSIPNSSLEHSAVIYSDVMAPTPYMVPSEYSEEPISRTYQYRKVMKPMLERKRRARINRCLDELKELMVTALQSEGENVSKLEKADILELTVRHLHGLKRQHQLVLPQEGYADRFRAGFTQCAQEVSQFLSTPSETVDVAAGRKLLQHLGACVRQLDCATQYAQGFTPPTSPSVEVKKAPMWRPW